MAMLPINSEVATAASLTGSEGLGSGPADAAVVEDETLGNAAQEEHEKASLREFGQNRKGEIGQWLNEVLSRSSLYAEFLTEQLAASTSGLQPPGAKPGRKSKGRKSAPNTTLKTSTDSKLQQPTLLSGGTLRDYQLEGFRWLVAQFEHGINGILADEMGLGKTIQFISLVCHLVEHGVTGPFIVVAPLSTVPNWVNEFNRFAPEIPVLKYYGEKHERPLLHRKINQTKNVGGINVHPVVITSYNIAMNDRASLTNYHWCYLVVDEGHRLKNMHCKLILELKKFSTDNRLLLTGTPLQNDLSELWSLLNFLLPEVFNKLDSFERYFDFMDLIFSDDEHQKFLAKEMQEQTMNKLHQILAPFLLRRLKADVDIAIPPKVEVLVYAPMTKQQMFYYQLARDRVMRSLVYNKEDEDREYIKSLDENVDPGAQNKRGRKRRAAASKVASYDVDNWTDRKYFGEMDRRLDLEEAEAAQELKRLKLATGRADKYEQHIPLRSLMMLLRKAVMHPYLLEYPLVEETQDYKVDEDIVNNSGKMLILDRLLKELKAKGHRVLIFSQFTHMLDIIQDYAYYRGFNYFRLDGSTKLDDRAEMMKQFNESEDCFLFLISTRAGGLGINLTGADTVIIFDSDWNPQCDLQAQDRCHRIGQTNTVMVYRLVSKNTFDERIVEKATGKRRLEKLVIHNKRFKSASDIKKTRAPMGREEIMELLQSHDYDDVYTPNSEDPGAVLSDAALDRLLDRALMVEQRSSGRDTSAFRVLDVPSNAGIIP